MKKNINHLLIGLSVMTMLAACSKSFTEKTPNDSAPVDQSLNNEADLQSALNGMYASLRSTALFGNALLIEGDLLADNTFVETNNSGRYISSYQYTFIADDGELGQIWRAAYTSILNANFIINATPATVKANQLKAQALAARALLYFKLVNLYARPYTDNPNGLGVPLVLTYDAYKLPPRNTVAEVYAQIVKDLQAALATAPDYSSSITISKYAIEGLLAKVYLYMGNNTAAKTAAADVINNSGFTLVPAVPAVPAAGYAAFWANPAAQSNKLETLFEVDADVVTNNGYEDVAGLYYHGYGDMYASIQLYNLFSATDIRKSLLVAGTTKSGAPAIVVTKFPNAANADRDNLKVIRLAEVYLIAAEASLPGNEADARIYLNALAIYRDPSFTGYTAATTGATLLNAIVQERRKELAFEGDRFFDMNRLKRDIVRSQNAGAIQAGPANANLTIPYTSTRRILPIPQSEIQANAAIASQQNPGY